MARVRLRAPLKELAGGATDLQLAGATVGELLRELERAHPALAGWVLDEQGRIREHVNVFVNRDYGQESTAVGAQDRLHVIPAISGG
jgi:molybdopterin synthase sulfur carrier subunit